MYVYLSITDEVRVDVRRTDDGHYVFHCHDFYVNVKIHCCVSFLKRGAERTAPQLVNGYLDKRVMCSLEQTAKTILPFLNTNALLPHLALVQVILRRTFLFLSGTTTGLNPAFTAVAKLPAVL